MPPSSCLALETFTPALSHFFSPPPFLSCLLFYWKGLDAAQIAVARRDSLSSPPFINKIPPGSPRLSAATEEQQAQVRLSANSLSFFLSFIFFFFETSVSFLLDPPPSFTPSHPHQLQRQWGWTTDSLVCQGSSVCMCLQWENLFLNLQQRSFGEVDQPFSFFFFFFGTVREDQKPPSGAVI